jgi:hypothetical protein
VEPGGAAAENVPPAAEETAPDKKRRKGRQPAVEAASLKKGDRCEGDYDAGGDWFPGKVKAVRKDGALSRGHHSHFHAAILVCLFCMKNHDRNMQGA